MSTGDANKSRLVTKVSNLKKKIINMHVIYTTTDKLTTILSPILSLNRSNG